VFKRGDPADLDNYRGIAVGCALGKIYSLVLHARLSAWSEDGGHRARGQAGFRHGKRTADHVFVLKHLIDRTRAPPARGRRLFACFVDFTKAYDLVRRDLLMECLADLGVHGKMMAAIASMYWEAPVSAKSGLDAGDVFSTTRGVKQGDPLSPLLFGLFLDRVEAWLGQHAPECGVQLGADLVRVLLYADDLVLLAESHVHLQRLLEALHLFCQRYSMRVNVAKSAVVVFGCRKPRACDVPAGGWLYAGEALPHVDEFRYLGVVLHQTKGVSAATAALASSGQRAMWGMLGRCADVGTYSLSTRVELFECLVMPVLTYCSEVWGPSVLHACGTPASCMDNALQQVQTLFLRRVAGGLRKSTPRLPLLREFGAEPVARSWLRACAGLWNRAASMEESELLHAAAVENVTHLTTYTQSWAAGFYALVRRLGVLPGGLIVDGVMQHVSIPELLYAFDAWFYACWNDLPANPRDAPSDAVICCTYERWFAGSTGRVEGRWTDVPAYVKHTAGIPADHVRALVALRVGAHDLDVAAGRWRGVPRAQRMCGLCERSVGDELHMAFECERYDVVRQRHPELFAEFGGWRTLQPAPPEGDAMSRLMGTHRVFSLASFAYRCWLLHTSFTPDDVAFGDCLEDAFVPEMPDASGQFVDAEESFGTTFDDCQEYAFELDSEMEVFCDCNDTL
jgi:hypothetical protein